MSVVASLIIIVLLVALSAFFAGSETALTAASTAKMHNLEKQGDARARLVNKIRYNKEHMIGSLLMGNTLVNILASALATSTMIKLFDEAGVIYATIIITIVVLIFAEVLPKTFAFHHADKSAMFVARPAALFIKLSTPATAAIAWIVRLLLKLFGGDPGNIHIGADIEALRGAIELHRGPEQVVSEQRAMLRSILELSDVEVSKVMTHRNKMVTLNADEPLGSLLTQVLESPFTRLPLWKEKPDNIVGVVHAKSLLQELQAHAGRVEDIDIMTIATDPWFVPDTTSLSDQLQAFRRRREHFALVVDEYGTLMGMLTLEDILEEIVGDIDDELDDVVAGVRRQNNDTYMVDGTVTIRDLNREFEWNLPDQDYTTIAGLILYESHMVPEPGQSFTFFGFRFDVVKRQRNQITQVRITPPAKSVETQDE